MPQLPGARAHGLVLARSALFASLFFAVRGASGAAPLHGGKPDSGVLDTLQGRVVRKLEIEPHDIFDPLPDNRARPFYAIANRLHVRSRPSTVRSAVVVKPGDRWSADRAAETARRLRALTYLVPDSVTARADGDSVDVRVVTHDNWTTSPELTLESGGGKAFGSVSFTERNLAGLGASLSFAANRDPAGDSRSIVFDDGDVAGSHWHTSVGGGSGAAGDSRMVLLMLPYWADAAPTTMGASWSRIVSQSQLYENDALVARIPRRRERTEVLWGTGRRAADGTIQRLIGSFLALDDRFGASLLEPGAPSEFAGGLDELKIRRVAGEMQLWRPHYIVRRDVEQMDRNEDFDLGFSFAFKTGFSPQWLGGTADEGYGRLMAMAGCDAGRAGFGRLRGSVESRVRSGLRETLGQGGARWVLQPGTRLTLVTAGVFEAGHLMPRDFQLTLGGLDGLRAFPVRALTGTEVERANLEARFVGPHNVLQLVSLGAAAFWDAGRARGIGSGDEAWHHNVGMGLRVALPHSALNTVVRFDVAWPLTPANDRHRGPAYSFGSGQAF